jgi:hypothetical protein
VPAPVVYSGLAPGYLGLYQVDAQIPSDAPVGEQQRSLTIGGAQSNVDARVRAELLRRDRQDLAAVDDCDRPLERRFDPLAGRIEECSSCSI